MRCITIINYKLKNQPIFITEHLDDIMFQLGFRVLNPEFNATRTEIEENRKKRVWDLS